MAVTYTHKVHPRSRTIKIKIEPDGQVVVVTPQRVSQTQIDAFVQQQTLWIERAQRKVQQRLNHHNPDTISIFGKTYHQHIEYRRDRPVGVLVQGENLFINPVTPTPTAAAIKKSLEQFLKNLAEKYMVPRTHQLAVTMGISFSHITLRQQKTRWGSCSRQGTLNFNWRLVHYEPAIIDYVIIHELAHRKHMNHSDRFWQLVKDYDPAFREHRNWLRRFGSIL